MKLRTMFALRRTSDGLGKVREVATAMAFAGGRLTPLSAIGIAAHLAAFIVGICSKDLASVAVKWPRLNVANELHGILHSALSSAAVHRSEDWSHCEVDGRSVLMHMAQDWHSGAFHVEREPEAVLAWVREETWRRYGAQLLLAPVGRWGDSATLRPSDDPPPIDSTRAREVWARIVARLAANQPRAVLLDGPPRTGKSTIARQLVRFTAEMLGREARVLRVAVSDFAYLSPNVVVSAVELLKPDVLVLDDIDRFSGAAQLLGMFESVRQHLRLVVATSNDPKALPVALRLPGRIDEVLVVGGAGAELAACVLGAYWSLLAEGQQGVVAGWPVALIDDLRLRLTHLHGASAEVEVAELQRRAAEALGAGATSSAPAEAKS